MKILGNDLDVEVIGFGALNLDKLYHVEDIACRDEESYIKSLYESPGGSAANTIIGLSKLGIKTSYIGKISEDPDGDVLELNLAYNEVFTNNLIYSKKGETGKVIGFVDKLGNRALYVDSGVNDDISIDEINIQNITVSKIIHFTSFVGDSFNAQKDLIDKLDENIVLSFDPGTIYVKKGLDELKKILNRTNILLINEKELKILYDDSKTVKEIASNLLDYGIEIIVVKKGSNGVFAMNKDGFVDVKAFDAEVADTTGAGDIFNSGFLYSYLKGYSLLKSCKIANWISSKYIQKFGSDGFPSIDEVKLFENEIN
ncbi:MAG: carbohydrate kinase family protein [Methanobacteriaceae archaeon]|jgi:ribokinase|nr:carbohydrate kinase family protein [Methanobacteriaceae archaeon]